MERPIIRGSNLIACGSNCRPGLIMSSTDCLDRVYTTASHRRYVCRFSGQHRPAAWPLGPLPPPGRIGCSFFVIIKIDFTVSGLDCHYDTRTHTNRANNEWRSGTPKTSTVKIFFFLTFILSCGVDFFLPL